MAAASKFIPKSTDSETFTQNDRHTTIIPKSFWVGGMKYGVDLEEIHFENGQVIGNVQYARQRIVIDPSLAPIQTTEQTFIHELVHLLFHMCCEIDLQRNERLVDVFSQFLYQALTTAEPRPISDLYPSTVEIPAADLGDEEPGYLHAPDFNYDEPFFVPMAQLEDHTKDASEAKSVDRESDGLCSLCDEFEYSNMPTNDEMHATWLAMQEETAREYAEESRLEDEIEEESWRAQREEMMGWTDYADSCSEAHESGWFYDDACYESEDWH